MSISIEKILTNRFYIIDCLLDNAYFVELVKDESAVKKFTDYFLDEENLKEIKKLIKDGTYAKFTKIGRKGNKNQLVKDTAEAAVVDGFSLVTLIPISVFSPFLKSIFQNIKKKNREDEKAIDQLVNYLTYENIKNNLEGHLK